MVKVRLIRRPASRPRSTWQEVPQAVFLSWSSAMQRQYCAARDRDAAQYADTPGEQAWYADRARSYDAPDGVRVRIRKGSR